MITISLSALSPSFYLSLLSKTNTLFSKKVFNETEYHAAGDKGSSPCCLAKLVKKARRRPISFQYLTRY